MQLELAERPGQFYYLVELGLSLLKLGNPAGYTHLTQAARQALDPKRLPDLPLGPFLMLLEFALSPAPRPDGFPLTQQHAEHLAERHFDNAPPILWQRARLAFDRNDHAAAARLLEHLLHLANTHTYDRVTGFDPRILADDATLNLAVCHAHLGDIPRARQLLTTLLSSPTHQDRAQVNLDALNQAD